MDADVWGRLATDLATGVVGLVTSGRSARQPTLPVHERRLAELVRRIEEQPADTHTLDALARCADLSLFHFARIFPAGAYCAPDARP